jgi:1-acyl-sn-glycerol-3-phosphate acyltransferase
VKRDEFDRQAIQSVMEVLRAGEIVLVAPEGTRGQALKQGKEGIAYLASRSQAPIIPVAIEGTQNFPSFRGSGAWRGPGIRVTFGKPFRYLPSYKQANREQLRQMTDEAMYILASYLPENRRGFYADLSNATRETIEFI